MNQKEIELRDEKETGRVEAFSDGVFAIAITLLILDVHVPHDLPVTTTLGDALLKQWPSYLAFLTSFALIGIMWINHHKLFTLIKRSSHCSSCSIRCCFWVQRLCHLRHHCWRNISGIANKELQPWYIWEIFSSSRFSSTFYGATRHMVIVCSRRMFRRMKCVLSIAHTHWALQFIFSAS